MKGVRDMYMICMKAERVYSILLLSSQSSFIGRNPQQLKLSGLHRGVAFQSFPITTWEFMGLHVPIRFELISHG